MRVVATAGHVDHGKSSLVLALTGTDPDRWPEEKTRGLTIDLGFAFTTLPSGQELGFVDVPGHVRFLKNMLAGVGAVEAAVLVVAATEGGMPQSEEHLRILDLLGISHGLAVITKADLVDDDLLELARLGAAGRPPGAASVPPTEELAEAGPGRRVALNLAGVDHTELARGSALVLPDQWTVTTVVDAALTALPDVKLHQGVYKAYIGSGEHDVRLRLISAGTGAPS